MVVMLLMPCVILVAILEAEDSTAESQIYFFSHMGRSPKVQFLSSSHLSFVMESGVGSHGLHKKWQESNKCTQGCQEASTSWFLVTTFL